MNNAANILIVVLCCTLIGCGSTVESKKDIVPVKDIVTEAVHLGTIEVHKDSLRLNGNEGNWYHHGKLFTGYGLTYHPNGELRQKVGFYKGKKHGIAQLWFSNGVLKVESHYNNNKLEGPYRAWWKNGVLAFEACYKNGKLEGIEKNWYETGQLAKRRNLMNGEEQGLQQAWLRNGTLYVNYEAKNGRIFGMRRANLCYQLTDEKVIITKD